MWPASGRGGRDTLLEAYADHQVNGAFVVGDGRGDWREFDFAAMHVVVRSQSRVIVETVGGHAFVDPFLPVVVLANQMRHREGLRTVCRIRLRPGDPHQPLNHRAESSRLAVAEDFD